MMPAVMQALKSSCENYVPFNICASQNILLLSQKSESNTHVNREENAQKDI